MPDVIIIGGGVIGLSVAYELAEHGLSVRILEQGAIGKEASWAGAGMLPPGNPAGANTPESRLRSASHELWPDWSQRLRDATGIDNGFLRCGGIQLADEDSDADLVTMASQWDSESVKFEAVVLNEIRKRFAFLNPAVIGGLWLPEMGQVRNPRHLKALAAACALRGVELSAGQPVVGVERNHDRILAVRTPAGECGAGEFVFAGGAWSQNLLRLAGIDFPSEPVRGQIVLLRAQPLPFRCVIEQGSRYLVPRPDGRILVGSTQERVGFVKANTADAVAALIRFAIELVPDLKSAEVERTWSGLRPFREGGLPYIGRIEGLRNATIAAGHFRAGLQLSPITAVLMRQAILGNACA